MLVIIFKGFLLTVNLMLAEICFFAFTRVVFKAIELKLTDVIFDGDRCFHYNVDHCATNHDIKERTYEVVDIVAYLIKLLVVLLDDREELSCLQSEAYKVVGSRWVVNLDFVIRISIQSVSDQLDLIHRGHHY